jgi:tetratricopeptide (TPR) repeat protein
MNRWQRLLAFTLTLAVFVVSTSRAFAEGEGQKDLNEALRVKITAEGLRELNQVIELLESAIDKGLDVENSDFAEQVLSESLLERAMQLSQVVAGVPEESMGDARIQRVRALAVSDLKRVMDYDNAPAEARTTLAQLLAMGPEEERTEARELLTKLIDSDDFAKLQPEEQAEAYALRAPLQKEAAQTLADFARAVELAPADSDVRLSRARFQFENDDVEGALAEVAAVVEKTPDQIAARLLQSQILRTLKRYDEALESLAKVAELAPSSPLPHQYRGEIYREMGQFDKAIEEFSRVLQIEPDLDLALIRRAEAYFFADMLEEALADVDAVLKDNPELALAHGLRAQILAGQEKFADAITEMKLLIDELPGQPDLKMHLALYYQLNNQTKEAIAAYTEVLGLDSKHYLALRSRGDAYLNLGEHEKAVADFAEAIKLEPEDSALLNNYAWVLATSPDDEVRNKDLSLKLAEKACELTEHGRPHILSTLGAAYADRGDFDKAIEWLKKALEINESELEAASAAADEEVVAELNEMSEELHRELASYEAKKPVRERQTEEEAAKDGKETDRPADADSASAEARGPQAAAR